MKPLDDLGAALRDVVERSRHDIDWSKHPLMDVYLKAGLQHPFCHHARRSHRHAASRERK